MRVVVTGATSMIGVALIEKCIKEKTEVYALIHRNSKNKNRIPQSELVTNIECDLWELEQASKFIKQADVFYHLAWTHTNKAERVIIEFQQENIKYCLDAIGLAKKLGCQKFIGAGSQAEYGRHVDPKTSPFSRVDPITPYGVAKYTAGKLAAIKALQEKIDFAWVRIFSIYGKYDAMNTLISSTIRKLKKGEHCAFTEGVQKWDYLYSDDAGNALFLIGKKLSGNKVYCLGSGESFELRQYIEVIREIVNPNAKLGMGEIPYTEGEIGSMCADISLLKQDTGFIPDISFREGIRRIVEGTKYEI